MDRLKRTATCGELSNSDVGSRVVLNGWVHRRRDHGGIIFLDVRDRYGRTQVVVDADSPADLSKTAQEIKLEFCIAVSGSVRRRPDDMVNQTLATGEIEVAVDELAVLSRCDTLPFAIEERTDAREELRFRFRYLDLRSTAMQRKIELRHKVTWAIRSYLSTNGFLEIETPGLIRSTPEGARDFVVPSRIHPGKFFALPQSPQLFKQILMVSGFDRYFQIARCYRDEDARGDRQPEHTQIDIEMSFVTPEDVFAVVEGMIRHSFDEALSIDVEVPFQRIAYDDAMNRFGSDKPDLRYGLELRDFSGIAQRGEFGIFRDVVANGGSVKALVAPGLGRFSRSEITALEDQAKIYGAAGMAWMKVTEEGLTGGVSRFYQSFHREIAAALEAVPGDLVLMVGADWKTACTAMGAVRQQVALHIDREMEGSFRFCWITDFPLFDWNAEKQRWEAAHHMFTMPQEPFIPTLEQDPGAVKGELYDLVCNGVELASGSIRIHDPELQRRIFAIVGMSDEEARQRFGFLLEAFRFGPPPHGGIAPGLDRLVMLMAGESSIREVIAFPKNTVGASLMDDAPSEVDAGQLAELHITTLT